MPGDTQTNGDHALTEPSMDQQIPYMNRQLVANASCGLSQWTTPKCPSARHTERFLMLDEDQKGQHAAAT